MKAKDITVGMRFTYVGAFAHYFARSKAEPDPTYPGKVRVHAIRLSATQGTVQLTIRLDAERDVEVIPQR